MTDFVSKFPQSGVFPLDGWARLSWSGADWKSWLQGQLTQDLRLLSHGSPISFCMCKPTGQILALGRIYEQANHADMIVPQACVVAIQSRFDQMVIMEEVELVVHSESLWHQFGNLTRDVACDGTQWNVDRVGSPGFDFNAPHDPTKSELATIDTGLFESLRLESEIPKYGVDINERTMPPELGVQFDAAHVSYTKGCFTGQEILHRLHSRGHTNQTWRVIESSQAVAPGDAIMSGDRKVGTVTSVASSLKKAGKWLVAGFIRNDAGSRLEINGVEVIFQPTVNSQQPIVGSEPAIIE